MPFSFSLARTSPVPAKAATTVKTLVAGSVLAMSLFAGHLSHAAGGGDGGSAIVTPTCKKNRVWDRRKRKCVKVKKSSGLDDDNIFFAARDLAYHRRYEEAIAVLQLANNPDDPRILNFMGYSTRKLGRVEEGLTYYAAALKADPDYTLVREYMGEAFLQLGDVDKAREQLSEIEKRCGQDCREYTMLSEQIAAHTKQ